MSRTRSALVAATAAAVMTAPVLLSTVLLSTPAAATTTPAVGPVASLRLAHLSPTTAPMDVYATPFDGSQSVVLEDIGYGAVSDYVATEPGTYVFSWRVAGSSPSSPAQLTMSAVLDPGAAYTVAGIGAADDVNSVLISDDLTPPATGEARVRFINADSEAGAVDLTAVGGPVLVRDAEFASVTGYAAVPAGPWTLDVVTERVPAGAQMKVELPVGSVNTLLLLESDSPVGDLTAVIDSGGLTRIGRGSAMSLTSDAVGAPAAPAVGGVDTGAGGLAPDPADGADTSAPVSLTALLLAAVFVAAPVGALAVTLARLAPATSRRRLHPASS